MSGPARRRRGPEEILAAVVPVLKAEGLGAPVDTIMKAAGLTSGALYSQFENKDDLCAQAIGRELDGMLERYRAVLNEQGRHGLRGIIERYLSEEHAKATAEGCVLAALGPDMAKAGAKVKRTYEARTLATIELFAGVLEGSAAARRKQAQRLLSAMLGGLVLARLMHDPEARREHLGSVRAALLAELG